MPRLSPLHRAALAGLAALLAAACSSKDKEVLTCPTVGFLNDVDRLHVFRPGAGTDLSEVIFDAQFGRIAVDCDFDKAGVELPTSFEIIATRGPADTARQAEIPFFVAITDPSGEIVAKEVYRTTIPFADNRRRVGRREEIEPYIPLPEDRKSIAGYQVLIGFQLTEEQLRYNRSLRR